MLTDPYGNDVFDISSSTDAGPYTLTYSGTYTLTIYRQSAPPKATGAYGFILDDASKATTIALTPGSGTTESGTLATGLADQPLPVQRDGRGVASTSEGQLDSPTDNALALPLQPGRTATSPTVYLDSDSDAV